MNTKKNSAETFKDKVDKWIPWDKFLNMITLVFLLTFAYFAVFVF